MKKLIVILVLALTATTYAWVPVYIDTYWQGTTGDWSDPDNWSNGEPTGHNVYSYLHNSYINNGGTVQITQAGEIFGDLYLGQNQTDSGNAILTDGGHLFGGIVGVTLEVNLLSLEGPASRSFEPSGLALLQLELQAEVSRRGHRGHRGQ